MSHVAYQLIFVIAVTQLLDAATTIHALNNGAREVNTLMKALMDRFGVKLALALKGAAVVGLAIYLQDQIEALVIVASVYVLVIAWNLIQIRKL